MGGSSGSQGHKLAMHGMIAIVAFCLVIKPSVGGVAADESVPAASAMHRTVEPILDEEFGTTTSGADDGHPGCDHYRHGLLALTLCTSYYPAVRKGKPYVQVMGSLTNEGSVDICNLTVSVERLSEAVSVSPAWFPHYPRAESFKAGTYLSFSVVLPAHTDEGDSSGQEGDQSSSWSSPAVDVSRSLFACGPQLQPLPEEAVVPAPGSLAHHEQELTMTTGQASSSPSLMPHHARRTQWEERLLQVAGEQQACLAPCLDSLHYHRADGGGSSSSSQCSAAAYLLHSNCSAHCPLAVHEWVVRSCHEAGCGAATCHAPSSSSRITSISSPAHPRATLSRGGLLLMVVVALVAAVMGVDTSYGTH